MANYLQGLSYLTGINNQKDLGEAKDLILKSAKTGNANAMLIYTLILLQDKKSIAKNSSEIQYWLEKASGLGNRYAQTIIVIFGNQQNAKYARYYKRLLENSKSFGYAQYYRGYILSQTGNK